MGKSVQSNVEHAKIVPQVSEQGLALLPDIRTSSNQFDHTLLKPDAAFEQINKLCEEAAKYGFKVSSCYYFFRLRFTIESTELLCNR